ncbi:DNA polymerase III subunit gamma/tau [Gordonibacter massiliensis (ex Traore et al. 2017)]|uniref:DNA polymerase III subunit gamma/tau n=1 Tax=Gordonibacter massiliensis (ex Traore et al. 2017) TaxID=1841863 RepID=A0A842JA18_9ACTN|nr:DNA polymerase III subunit gamma/tau [Gordonibacter massiliensis (ex Traore et al. 2017)]MBC2888653.1 DNA polymerase III subunit gamma/tau [Gordonibacter massiliensis (ex Traore et al. 2017)]
MAEALYRKYRPQIFEDVVGQEHIERTIKNAIEQDKVSHAYLFTGPRGTGKTTTARLLAKALLCEHGPTPEPDGTCDDCVMIANGEHPDVYELDAASRTGVENVREEIIGRVQFAPTRGRYKIYIIDEVHMLSTAAFNALLKTLEEPPSHVVFILATTDPQKVPETIHSRCQRFDFRRISAESIVSRLGAICVAEDVEFEGEALDLIAHRAEGGMRNALTSLEQLIAFGEGKVTLEVAERLLGGLDTNDLAEIMRAIGTRDVAACFRWTADYIETGADLAQFTRDLAEHVRNMYVLTLAGADVALEVSDATRRELTLEMQWFGADRLARLLGVLGDLSAELKTSTNPRLSFEIALTRMVRPDSDLTLEALAERVEALESGHSAVAHVTAAVLPNGGVADAAASRSTRSRGDAGDLRTEVRGASAIPTISGTAETLADVGGPAGGQGQPAPAAFARDQPAAGARASQVDAQPASAVAQPNPAVAQPAPAAAQPAAASVQQAGAPAASQPAVAQAAPAAGAGAVPSAELAASLQNPAALQRIWQAALSTLKKNKAAYGVLFLNTKALYRADKGLLVIEFPAENSFAFKAVQKPDVQEAVLTALTQACGAALPFTYVQGPGAEPAASAVAPVAEAAAPAAASSAPVASAAASVQASPTAAQQPAPQPSSPAAVPPEPDPAPLDAYDLPPYDDEIVPYDDYDSPAPQSGGAGAAPASSGAPSGAGGSAAPSGQPSPTPAPAASAQPGLPPEPDARTSPSVDAMAPVQSPDELEAILAAGFGDGVIVEEVRE